MIRPSQLSKHSSLAVASIDHTDALSVHLLRGNERRAAESMFASDFPMNAVQSGQRFHLIMRHLDAGDAQSETVNEAGQRARAPGTVQPEADLRSLTGSRAT